MEQRKLIQHGASSLTLALPIKWVKEQGLSKGDALFVEEEGNKLIISPKEKIHIESISVDISDLDRSSVIYYIMSLYRFGYNEIEVNFNRTSTIHYRSDRQVTFSSVVHEIVNRLIGAEIIEQSKNRILIKTVTREAEEDFQIILRRIFLLLKESFVCFLEGIEKKDFDSLKIIEQSHDNINKFVSYCLRLLNKKGYPDVKKTCYFFHIIASIDKIMDILKYSSRSIIDSKIKMTDDAVKIIGHINLALDMYYDLFYNFSLKKVNKLDRNRDFTKTLLKQKASKLGYEELLIVCEMKQVLELLLDLTDFRMGLEAGEHAINSHSQTERIFPKKVKKEKTI